MGDKGKSAKVAAEQIFTWAVKGATSLWSALGPVWSTFKTLWKVIEPIWEVIYGVYDWVASYVNVFYESFIKPALSIAENALGKINEVIRYIDKIYSETIGKIEKIYDEIFGPLEALKKHIEDTAERIARVAGIFSKDLGESILKLVDDFEAATIGRIEGLRDTLTHKIDGIYATLRDRINDTYYAMKDIIDPVIDKVFKIGDDLGISFAKPDLLRKETIVKSADTYGQDWMNTIHEQGLGTREEQITHGIPPPQIHTFVDDQVDDLEAGLKGTWADVVQFIEDNVKSLDAGEDPTGFNIDKSLLPEQEIEEIGTS